MGSEELLPRINSEKWGMFMENIFLVSQSPDHEAGGWNIYLPFRCMVGGTLTSPIFQVGGVTEEGTDCGDRHLSISLLAFCLLEKPDLSDSLCYDVIIAHENTSTRCQVSKKENPLPVLLRICAMFWDASTVHITQKYSVIKHNST